MEHMIKLPSETNPLTAENLYKTLGSASSAYQLQIQTGAKQLHAWETSPGYYPLLQDVFVDPSLPFEFRYQAVIQLKNGIDKYWRKTAKNAVNSEDRTRIRSRLLESGIQEADPRIALQNAVVIGKVARFEYPSEWPDIITSLTTLLRSSTQSSGSNPLHTSRGFLILLYIIKELSTARLQRSRASLQAATPEIVHVVGSLYVELVRRWTSFLQHGGDDEGGAIEDIERSLLAIKVLRRLLVSGYEFPNRDKDVSELWNIARAHFGDFLAIVTRDPPTLAPDIQDLITKHLLQLSKLHVDIATTHPAAYALLPDSINLTKAYWGLVSSFGQHFGVTSANSMHKILDNGQINDEEKSIMEQLSLKGLLILRACVRMVFNPQQTFKFRKPEDKEEKKHAQEVMRDGLLSQELGMEIMEVVVTRFFVLREVDLRDWTQDAEEWERKEDSQGDGYMYAVRPCAERLFLDLMINFKEMLVQPLLQVFYKVATLENDNILLKDSVYTAVALSAAVLHQQLDFDTFLKSVLIAEVNIEKPGYNIIRRSIAILLGQWVTVKISAANRPLVYQVFQHLLDPRDQLNDQVVKITAARQFKNVVNDLQFEPLTFKPFAPGILGRIMALIGEMETTETKMALLDTVSVLVERMESEISPFADQVISLLPNLWDQSGDEHLMKQSILTVLARLFNSMKSDSQRYHTFALPLVQHTVEPDSTIQEYLLDDALDLWAAILVQTPAPASPQLLALVQYLFPLYKIGTENLRKSLEITESYFLLAPSEMLNEEVRFMVFTSFAALLGTVKHEASGSITGLVEIAMRAAEGIGGPQAVDTVGQDLVRSEFFKTVLAGLRGSWEAHQTTGPNKAYPPVDGMVETDYFSVLARLIMGNPQTFVSAMQSLGATLEDSMKWLLDEWFSHFENVGHPSMRKLHCIALTRLLELNQSWILSRLQDLMTIWTDVVTELKEGAEEKGGDSLIYWDRANLHPKAVEIPEENRRSDLTWSDPVHTVNIIEFIKAHVQQIIAACGGPEAFQRDWVANVDSDIVQSFGALGIL